MLSPRTSSESDAAGVAALERSGHHDAPVTPAADDRSRTNSATSAPGASRRTQSQQTRRDRSDSAPARPSGDRDPRRATETDAIVHAVSELPERRTRNVAGAVVPDRRPLRRMRSFAGPPQRRRPYPLQGPVGCVRTAERSRAESCRPLREGGTLRSAARERLGVASRRAVTRVGGVRLDQAAWRGKASFVTRIGRSD